MQGSSAESNMNNLDFSNNWRVNEHAFDGAGYPQLSWQTYAGSSSNPYQISTCQQLQDMQNDLDANYELVNNVDCTGFSFSSVGDYPNVFTGVLHGQGYVVENLEISEGGSKFVGLIGYLGSGGQVKNIGVVDVDITGGDTVGGLVGYNYAGSVSDSYSTGNVGNGQDVGGLVGQTMGDVSGSFSAADFNFSAYVGSGLVGLFTHFGCKDFRKW